MSDIKVGSRVYCDLFNVYGIIKQIKKTANLFESKTEYLIAEDGYHFVWVEKRHLELSTVELPLNYDSSKQDWCPINPPLVLIYLKSKFLITVHKNDYTVKDLPQIEKDIKEMFIKGYTGYCYAIDNAVRDGLLLIKKESEN